MNVDTPVRYRLVANGTLPSTVRETVPFVTIEDIAEIKHISWYVNNDDEKYLDQPGNADVFYSHMDTALVAFVANPDWCNLPFVCTIEYTKTTN